MLLTAEQHGRIAAFYEQAAKDDPDAGAAERARSSRGAGLGN